MSGNAATGIRSADQFKNQEPSQKSHLMFISGESSRPLIKESFANAFRKSVRTAGVVADAHPCLLASTRAVDRLGRIAGHAERSVIIMYICAIISPLGGRPAFHPGFADGQDSPADSVKRGEVPAPRSYRLLRNISSRICGSYRNSISDIGKLYFKCAAEMSDALPCERKSVHLPRNQNGGIRGGRIEAL